MSSANLNAHTCTGNEGLFGEISISLIFSIADKRFRYEANRNYSKFEGEAGFTISAAPGTNEGVPPYATYVAHALAPCAPVSPPIIASRLRAVLVVVVTARAKLPL